MSNIRIIIYRIAHRIFVNKTFARLLTVGHEVFVAIAVEERRLIFISVAIASAVLFMTFSSALIEAVEKELEA